MIKFTNTKFTLALLSLACLLPIGVAQAKSKNLEFNAVEEKKIVNGTFQMDESKGYIFLHSNSRQFGVFIKQPSEADIQAYETDWAEKFEKAKKKYTSKLKRWEKLKEAKASKPGKKPIEPTAENFSIGPIELRNSVSFGPQFVFNKDKSDKENPVFRYMIEVEPGNYLYHGPVFTVPGTAASGVCFCLGSVQFQVKPGEITDLGNFLTNAPALDNGGTSLVGTMFLQNRSPDSKQLRWLKNPVAYGVPESLSSYEAVKADFSPSGKMNNVYRAMVSRMGPVDGLFRYDRDKMVDLKVEPEPEANQAEPEIPEVDSAEGSGTVEEAAVQPEAS
ncbi:hypothetical protein [Sphingorhabdus sp. Alg231-15]|uniref:hypothetical protein n=1 Tax=Sphingorhabdus sp. Alg231-15 TaxID=1922222 RepID=UPI000D55A2EE